MKENKDKLRVEKPTKEIKRIRKKRSFVSPFKLRPRKQVFKNTRRVANWHLEEIIAQRDATRDSQEIEKYRKLINIATVIGVVAVVLLAIWGGNQGLFTDREKMRLLLERAGFWAPLIFVFIQIVQCVIPIIPGGVSLLIGVYVFGPWMGFLYNYIGIILGSTAAFFLARIYGKAFVRVIVNEKSYNKYISWLDRNQKKFNVFFAVAMILPGMPDDIICMIAGLSKMKARTFILTLLWTKVPTIILYTLFLDKAFEGILSIFQ